MPAITLSKGTDASVTDALTTATTVTVGFSWDVVQSDGPMTEVVPCAIVCGEDGLALGPQHVVFFNQARSPGEAVSYVPDGSSPGDDVEQIEVDLRRAPSEAASIALVLYVNPDLRQPGTFDDVRDCVVRVLDRDGAEVVRYPFAGADLSPASAVVAADLRRRGDGWTFRAIGQGVTGGVASVAQGFGVVL